MKVVRWVVLGLVGLWGVVLGIVWLKPDLVTAVLDLVSNSNVPIEQVGEVTATDDYLPRQQVIVRGNYDSQPSENVILMKRSPDPLELLVRVMIDPRSNINFACLPPTLVTSEGKQVATQTTWFDFPRETPVEEVILPRESYLGREKALAAMAMGQPYLIVGGWQDVSSAVTIEARKIWLVGCGR